MSVTRRDVLAAAPTMFTREGELDLRGTENVFASIADSGVTGAFIIGTSGEFVALSAEERIEVTRVGVKVFAGRDLVVHVGTASGFQTIDLISRSMDLGVTSFAVLTPYYFPASASATLDFYRRVCRPAGGMRVFAYLFEARTGTAVNPRLLAEIAEIPEIVGAKVSGQPLSALAAYRVAVPDDFLLFTGADRDLAAISGYGVQGVVSGVASAFPEPFTQMTCALESGNPDDIASAQTAIDAVVGLLQDPACVKAALRLRGVHAGYSRMPFDEPSPERVAAIESAVELYG